MFKISRDPAAYAQDMTSRRPARRLYAQPPGLAPGRGRRDPPGMPDDEPAPPEVTVTVRLRADGELVVSSPGTPPHRIVAIRTKRARAAGQRVAELVEEALQARDHAHQGPTSR